MSTTRPDIIESLDIRSNEQAIVVSNPDSVFEYPEDWVTPPDLTSLEDALILHHGHAVIIVDRVEISTKVLELVALYRPRLMAFAIQPGANQDHEKSVRRMVTTMFPWNELWTVSSTFGKMLVTKDVQGTAYDRDKLIDMRTGALA